MERKIEGVQKSSRSGPFMIDEYPVYDLTVESISENKFRAVLADELVLEYTDEGL